MGQKEEIVMCQQCDVSRRNLTLMLKKWVKEDFWAKEGDTWFPFESKKLDYGFHKKTSFLERLWMSVTDYILGKRKKNDE